MSGAKKDNDKFKKENGRTPAYGNYTCMLSNVNRETIIEVHEFALSYYTDQGKSAWQLDKEKFDDTTAES